MKERRSRLPRNDGNASGEPTGRKLGGWDEADVGAVGNEASVDVCAAGRHLRRDAL